MAPNFSTDWEDIQGKQYAGYGRCIYCGGAGDGEGLRREQILEFSLGGNTWIDRASCLTCQRLIDPIERHLGHAVYGQYRIHAGVQTRNPRERPTELPATFRIDGREVTMKLPIDHHPFSLILPLWGDAGYLRAARIDEPFPEPYWNYYHQDPPNLREILGLSESQSLEILRPEPGINEKFFARAIAKIAYCHAVMRLGLGGFRPLALPDIILGRCPAVSYFVGAALMNPPPPPLNRGYRHAINFHELTAAPARADTVGSGIKLLIADIRLFDDSAHADHGMPIYHVVVGTRSCQHVNSLRRNVGTQRVVNLGSI